MNDKPLYNSRVIITYLEYLKHKRPDINIEDLLSAAGIGSYEVEDEGHWLTQQQVNRFHDVLTRKTNDPSISREAGRYMLSAQSTNAIRQFLLGFITPIQAYIRLGKIASYINRGSTFHVKKISRNAVEITVALQKGIEERPFQCENRMGSLEAVATLLTNQPPMLEHTDCVHQGGDCCRYILSWEEPKYIKWRRLRNYTAAVCLCVMLIGLFTLSWMPITSLGALLAGIVFGLSYYALYAEKQDINDKIEKQGDAANRLLDQITISYNNALLVQEIGHAVSNILDIDQLLTFIMETLQKRLDFDRGMIMLANPEKTRLVYVSGYGYSPPLEAILKETQFHLDKPHSQGPFVIAFKQQEPFLIKDIRDVQQKISPRSLEFVEQLGVKSFICVPIVYEGRSEGVLAVDNYQSHRPYSQSDVNLLMGIAPQIAISINNAKSLSQIMESEERFRTLSENSPDIIYTTDNKGLITYINPVAEDILGYMPEEEIGRPFTELIKSEQVDSLTELFHHIQQTQETIKHYEGTLLAKDGSERLFDMSGAPNLSADGSMMGIVGTLRDVTEQRKLEHQLNQASKMSALGTLTGGISHDFNNILQAISAYHQLLMITKTESSPDWKYLMSIKGLTKRATDLVRQLLIFSRKVDSTLVPVDINSEIRNFYDLLASTLPKSIVMELDLAENIRLINGDKAQLGQVIVNLAVNAKDAMPGGGKLNIKTQNIYFDTALTRGNVLIQAGQYVLIRISDTGCGIKAEDLDHIFEPFFTTKEAGKGTGIGLSVVYGVMKNHNGYIFCSSKPDQGTTFELYMPALDLTALDIDEEADVKSDLVKGQETILLVDDEPSLLETGQELLSLLGYQVLTADSGERALEIIAREGNQIDLVILDLMMPGMGGEKCLPEILKRVPSMKVIIASGYTAHVRTEDIIRIGAVSFLQKPYHLEDLNKKIRRVLEGNAQSL